MRYIVSTIAIFSYLLASQYSITGSKVVYYGDHALHKWEGSTNSAVGTLIYDTYNKTYSCTVTIPLNTFSSGNDNRDSNMLYYCNAIEYPDIVFKSDMINVNKQSIDIEGIIEFAGEKRKLKTVAKLIKLNQNEFSIKGEFQIYLSNFNIARPSLLFIKMEDNILIEYSMMGVVNE
jgi:Uncharacterized conserved protein